MKIVRARFAHPEMLGDGNLVEEVVAGEKYRIDHHGSGAGEGVCISPSNTEAPWAPWTTIVPHGNLRSYTWRDG